MNRTYVPKLADRSVVPYFRLPSNRETFVSPTDYKQRNNLVVVFFHSIQCSDCRWFLTKLATSYSSFQETRCEVLAISPVSVEGARRLADELGLPFPVLADDTGKVTEQYTYMDPATRTAVPAVFVVDRFGALYSQSISATETDLPAPEEILSWLEIIELQCPECGVSEWTMPGA